MNSSDSSLDLLEFPLDYEFKAFGPNSDDFNRELVDAVSKVVPVSKHSLRERLSSSGKYRSVTLLVRVQSREQLQQVYQQIRSVKDLKYIL